MELLPSQNFLNDLERMHESTRKKDRDAAALIQAILEQIEQDKILNWPKLTQNGDVKLIGGIYLNACVMKEFKLSRNCTIFRLKGVTKHGKQMKELPFRIVVGQSPKNKKKLGLIGIFKKVKKGNADDFYIPTTEEASSIIEACRELGISIQ